MKTTNRHTIITALAAVVLTTSCWTEHGINRPPYEPETYVPPYKVYGNTMEALGNNSIVIVEELGMMLYGACVHENPMANIFDGRIRAVDIESGRTMWWFPPDTSIRNDDSFGTKFLIHGRYLVTISSPEPNLFTGGFYRMRSDVVCVDLVSGTETGRFEIPYYGMNATLNIGRLRNPVIHDGRVYFLGVNKSYRMTLYSALLDDLTDVRSWEVPLSEGHASHTAAADMATLDDGRIVFGCRESPSTDDGNIYVADHYVCIFDPVTSDINKIFVHRTEGFSDFIDRIVSHNGRIYALCTGYLCCIDPDTGTQLWHDDRGRGPFSNCLDFWMDVLSGSRVVSTSCHDMSIYSCDGHLYDRYTNSGKIFIEHRGYTYVIDRGGDLLVMDPTGNVLDSLAGRGPWGSYADAITISDDKLYLSTGYDIYCFPTYPWERVTVPADTQRHYQHNN